jgi:hypothetical protein
MRSPAHNLLSKLYGVITSGDRRLRLHRGRHDRGRHPRLRLRPHGPHPRLLRLDARPRLLRRSHRVRDRRLLHRLHLLGVAGPR